MSISHKAYLFDHASFTAELAGILYDALEREDVRGLRQFIERHLDELLDFGSEEPPGEDWEQECHYLGKPSVQRYADLALTKYYDFTDDWGLDHGFDALDAYLSEVEAVRSYRNELICGHLFGPKGRRLDPGSMGTGLLSPEDVRRLHRLLEVTTWPTIPGLESDLWDDCHYRPHSREAVGESLSNLRRLYQMGAEQDRGLLLIDYNDTGVGRL